MGSATLRIRDIGEFGLITALRDALPPDVRSPTAIELGIGDDAAIWTPPPGESVAISTDTLVETVHFRLDPGWSSWADVGHKALAVNLSDMAAMGATPVLATIGLALRGDERVEDVVAAYQAIGELARRYGCAIAGGDVVASPSAVMWNVTVLGTAPTGTLLTRSGARPGDIIAVSGTIGASAAGFEILGSVPDAAVRGAMTADLLVAAHRRPEPRVRLGQVLRESDATAAMDLSDGLFGDLPRLLDASGVAAEIDLAAIPVAAAVRGLFPQRWQDLATRGGEDFELLATLPPDAADAIVAAAAAVGQTLTPVGTILPRIPEQPALRVRGADGHVSAAEAGAWDHFGRSVSG